NGERLVALLKALDAAGIPAAGTGLEDVLDVDEVLRYWAAQTVLINLDGYQGVMLHNYYLYELDGRFSVIPWDFNMSFAGFSASISADGGYLYIDTPVAGTTMEARPLIHALLSDKTCLERYRGYLRELVEGVFSEKSMQAQIAGLTALIDPYVKADPTSFFTYDQFLAAVDLDAPASLKSTAAGSVQGAAIPGDARNANNPGGGIMGGNVVALMSFVRGWNANITAQLAGEIPSTGTVTSSMGGRNPGAAPGGAGRNPGAVVPGGAAPGRAVPGGANAGAQPLVQAEKKVEASRRSADSLSPAELAALAAVTLSLLATTLLLRRRRNLHTI
ncbi:MAG TPA: CotH kinase family protein, partial [Clostridia bacterium]